MQMVHGSHDHLYYWGDSKPDEKNVRDNPLPWKYPILGQGNLA